MRLGNWLRGRRRGRRRRERGLALLLELLEGLEELAHDLSS
jgi:hypothetical protein